MQLSRQASAMEDNVQRSAADKPFQELIRLVDSFDIGALVTVSLDGDIRARPMAIEAYSQDPFYLLFVTDSRDGKVEELATRPRAAVTLQRDAVFVSLSGHVTIEKTAAELKESWRPSWQLWFAESAEEPQLTLLRFRVNFAEYWNRSGKNQLHFLWEAGKALLTGGEAVEEEVTGHAKIEIGDGASSAEAQSGGDGHRRP
jgi:general stress protein 26